LSKLNIEVCSSKHIWNSFFNQQAPEAFFQSWFWGDVEKQLNTKLKRSVVFQVEKNRGSKKQSKRLIGLVQTTLVRARRGPFLHVRHGPILESYTAETLTLLTQFLIHQAQEEGAWFVRMSPLIDPGYAKLFYTLGYHNAPIHNQDAELVQRIDLFQTHEELLANMRKTTRYLIRKAESMGVVITQSDNLDVFLRMYRLTARRHGFIQHRGLAEEFAVFHKHNAAKLYIASYQKEILAGALIVFSGNQGIYHHGASCFTSVPASYLLQWEAIKEAKQRKMRYYNLWGITRSQNPKHPWKGITLFKQGFGGTEVSYMHAVDYSVSRRSVIPHIIERIRNSIRGYDDQF